MGRNNNNSNKDQVGRGNDNNNNYSGLNCKCKPDNTVAAVQRPTKDSNKKTSGGFKDFVKETCLWHPENNHTTEKCYQLWRAPKDTPEPCHPHEKRARGRYPKEMATSKTLIRWSTSSLVVYPPI
jgi:hypothetical protein